MARGDQHERTAEERERDRQERARRRAEREGNEFAEPAPVEVDPAAAVADPIDEAEPEPVPSAPEPLGAEEPMPEAPVDESPVPAPPVPERLAPDAGPAVPEPAADVHGEEVPDELPLLPEVWPAAEVEPPQPDPSLLEAPTEEHALEPLAAQEPAFEPASQQEPVQDLEAPPAETYDARAPLVEAESRQAEALAELAEEPLAPAEALAAAEALGAYADSAHDAAQQVEETHAPRAARATSRRVPDGGRVPPPPPLDPLNARSGGHRPRSGRARVGAVLALLVALAAIALLVRALTKSGASHSAPPAPAVVKVLIPEGTTRLQIAQIAAAKGLRGSYRVAARSSPLLDPRQYGAPAGTRDLEGFLFPATYDEYPGAPVSRLVSDQLTAFRENFGQQLVARAQALHLTPYQLLIVASMIEREAQVPGDRAKIAGVIYNRLHEGMPLGVDATIYYAVELEKNVPTYTQELTEAQLHLDSPYNTRTHTGLPPTPISNPGLASIEAAANPAHVSYLYYVNAPDGCGEMRFSTTQAKFEEDAAAYHAAVAANHGHPPTCKKG